MAAPAASPGMRLRLSVEHRGLPKKARKLSCHRHRGDAGWLFALEAQMGPALMKAPLAAPCDRHHARIHSALSALELDRDVGPVASVMGGFDQKAPGMA